KIEQPEQNNRNDEQEQSEQKNQNDEKEQPEQNNQKNENDDEKKRKIDKPDKNDQKQKKKRKYEEQAEPSALLLYKKKKYENYTLPTPILKSVLIQLHVFMYSGKIGSGKNYVAEKIMAPLMNEHFHSFKSLFVSFATELKY